MNLKRILSAFAALILLTGVADADVILDIVLSKSLEDGIIDTEIALEDLEIDNALETEGAYTSQEPNNAGKPESNAQKTISVSKDTSKKVYLGTRYQIVVSNNTIISCKSSSKKVAKVSKTGLITPKKAGKATISIQTKKKTLTLNLKVVDPKVPTKVIIVEGKRGNIRVGQTLQLTARVSPASANQSVRWKSSRKSVASVSSKGVVTGVKPGKTRITATAGKKQATFTVTVKQVTDTPAPTPTSLSTSTPEPTPTPAPTPTPTERMPEGTIELTIGGSTFTAKLEDNATARAFAGLLPVTINMSELNGNEKYYYLDESLPSAPEKVGQINAGDLMLYGNNCVVLFYKSFSTQYSYTRIGHINDLFSLESAVGSGSVQVRFTK